MGMKQRRRKLAESLVARAGSDTARATEIREMVKTLPKKQVVLMEALSGTALGDWGAGNDPQLSGYRRLTGTTKNGQLLRDLSPMSQESQAQVAHYLHTTNPLAKWLIDVRVDLVVGGEIGYSIEFDPEKMEGVSPQQAKDLAAKAKTELDRFWDHPAHSIRYRGREYLATFMVTGELCLVIAAENETTGVPTLDYIDSMRISGVTPLGESSMVPGTVLISRAAGDPIKKEIIRINPETERLEGDCFYWRNGMMLNAMRGQSELLAPADFLDSHDQFMFSQVDRALLQNQVVWDLLLEGGDDGAIKKRVQELRTELAKPGGIFGHNEKGKLTAATPGFGTNYAGDLQRVIANHIRGGKSLPETWYGNGGDANRSTAGDQTDVAYKTLEAWQTLTRCMFNQLLWYAYDNLVERQAGAGFPKRSEGAVTLTADLSPVRERDMGRASEAAVKLEPALEAAVAAEFLSQKTARKVFLQVIEKISGTSVDPDDEEKEIEAETVDRERKAMAKANATALDKTKKALGNGKPQTTDGTPDAGTRQPAGASAA